MSEDYEEIFSSLGGRLISLSEIEELLSLLQYPSRQLLLDIGTGTGRIARQFLKLNNEVVGIDINYDRLKLALKKAKSELGENANNYHLVLADAQHLPFRTSTLKIAFSIRTLKYLENPRLAFYEISRVLKHRGICVVELSNIFSYEALWLFLLRILGIKRYAQNMGSKYHLFNLFEIEQILKKLNLNVISKKAWHKIPTIIFIKCRRFTILKILLYIEFSLHKVLPFFLFSRGILIKCIRLRNIKSNYEYSPSISNIQS
ncbi:MAG: class I SAM-dependent methyltransferase [Candidatus Njordarchaeales archaeon]